MGVIHNRSRRSYARPKKSYSRSLKPLLIAVILIAGYSFYILQPVASSVHLSITPPTSKGADISWSPEGQAAVGIEGRGAIAVSAREHQASIASLTKVISALAVLQKKPLDNKSQGPTIAFSSKDIDIYWQVVGQDGVALPVSAGQKLTEYQVLEAMLLRSANNMAISLTNWAFGSQRAYADYANKMLKQLGLDHTVVVEASGLDKGSRSTPSDLMRLADLAMKSPVIRDITAKTGADIPGLGSIKNTNMLPGLSESVKAIKVGLTDEAGSCLLFWVKTSQNPDVRLYGVVLGQSDFKKVVSYANSIAQKIIPDNFYQAKLVSKGQKVASYQEADGRSASLVAKQDITFSYWRGEKISLGIHENKGVHNLEVTVSGTAKAYSLKQDRNLSRPSFIWKFTHPLSKL